MKTAELFEKLKANPEEAAKLQAECKTPEELYGALQQLGLTDSKEEFLAAVKEQLVAAGAVSEEELDKAVAAGGSIQGFLADENCGLLGVIDTNLHFLGRKKGPHCPF